ncbi:FAD-dependent pyridine nucleotide-disulfide oxidoreductase [Auricularia subglabra TFB-10046 SS5]|nr:FAD-dependent pyridine nucleotide-disulfide oxidoreductase [Auricularia subglabra TFB-10046 SS5]
MASPLPKLQIYDAIVLGSGQAGNPLAIALSKAGQKTALVEREHLGGCSANEGSAPSKTMIASGKVAHVVRHAHGSHSDVSVDLRAIQRRKRDVVNAVRSATDSALIEAGVDVLLGEASFAAAGVPPTVIVRLFNGGELHLRASNVFINTGARPSMPILDGIETLRAPELVSSSSVMDMHAVPDHLLVLGGGYVGVEFAQLMRRLGARVTIVQRAAQLMPREDEDISEAVTYILREDGVDVLLASTATSVASPRRGRVELLVRTSDGVDRVLSGSTLLVATGRTPNADILKLRGVGVARTSTGHIHVNEFCETFDDYRVVSHNVLHPDEVPKSRFGRLVPYTLFMDPPLAHVGLHEHTARQAGLSIRVAMMPMSSVARAVESGDSRGIIKAIVDADTDRIIGFTCLGVEGGELMNTIQAAILGHLKYQVLRDAVWSHPTLGEALNNLWDTLH